MNSPFNEAQKCTLDVNNLEAKTCSTHVKPQFRKSLISIPELQIRVRSFKTFYLDPFT